MGLMGLTDLLPAKKKTHRKDPGSFPPIGKEDSQKSNQVSVTARSVGPPRLSSATQPRLDTIPFDAEFGELEKPNDVVIDGSDKELEQDEDDIKSLLGATAFALPKQYSEDMEGLQKQVTERIAQYFDGTIDPSLIDPLKDAQWMCLQAHEIAHRVAKGYFEKTQEDLTVAYSRRLKEGNMRQRTALKTIRANHKASLEAAQEEKTQFQEELQELDARVKVLDAELAKGAHLRASFAALQAEKAGLLERFDQLQKDFAKQEEELGILQPYYKQAEEEKRGLAKELRQAQVEITTKENENNRIRGYNAQCAKENETLKNNVKVLKQNLKDADAEKTRLSRTIEDDRKKSKIERDQLIQMNNQKTNECTKYSNQHRDLELGYRAAQEKIRGHHKEIKELERIIDKLTQEKSTLSQSAQTRRVQDNDEIRRLQSELAGAENSIVIAEKRRREKQAEHESALRALEKERQAERSSLAQTHQQNLAQQAAEHRTAIEKLEAKYKDDINKLDSSAKDLEGRLVNQYTSTIGNLNKQVEELNEVLLTRDHESLQSSLLSTSSLPRKPDDKIKEHFMQVHQLVEELANSTWRRDPKCWSGRDMERASRQVKKAIVQDIAWSVLFRYVFCSPFRMLGDQGQDLEQEWQEECGQDKSTANKYYTWPAPGILAERWRYMTLKGCHEGLSKPVPSALDPRAAVKRGFMQNLDDISASMRAELENVIDVGSDETALVKSLGKTASVVWLDFQMHRCRIVLRLPGNSEETTAEKAAEYERHGLELTVSPQVGRYGNVKGVDLETFSEVRGCAGKTVKIP